MLGARPARMVSGGSAEAFMLFNFRCRYRASSSGQMLAANAGVAPYGRPVV